MSTLMMCAAFVAAMFVAIGHLYVVNFKIQEGYASSPFSRETIWNTLLAIICLVAAFLIPAPAYASTNTEAEIEVRLTTTFEILLRELPKLETKEQAEDLIRRHIVPITDSRKSAQLMLGKNWRKANDSQRDRFAKAMTDKLISTYAAFLLDERARHSQFKVVRITASESKSGKTVKYTVHTVVTVDQPADVIFTIYHRKGKDWGLVDVKAEGISMALTWRSTFASLIRKPSDIEKVILDLEQNKLEAKEAQ